MLASSSAVGGGGGGVLARSLRPLLVTVPPRPPVQAQVGGLLASGSGTGGDRSLMAAAVLRWREAVISCLVRCSEMLTRLPVT